MSQLRNHHTQDKASYRQRDGVSLLIAIGLVTVIGLFSIIIANIVQTSIRQAANTNRANEAYYAAEGALEQGLLANSKEGAGYSTGETAADNLEATFKIQGQVPENITYGGGTGYNGMYGIPAPGTGNAGANCDPLQAWTDKAFKYENGEYVADLSGGYDPADHPCNWNKITVGETISIPLYYTTTDSASGCPQDPADSSKFICNLVSQQIDEFILRVRAACSDGEEFCAPATRYDFDVSNNAPTYGFNEPIMTWQITGQNDTDQASMVMGPTINTSGGILSLTSTIIHEFRFNGSKASSTNPFEVLTQVSNGEDLNKCIGPILTYLRPNEPYTCNGYNWNETAIQKPVLKLSVIQSMKHGQGPTDTIPYLEYQMLTNFATGAPTDTSQTITAEGFSGEFKSVLEVKQPQEGGILEYVIQQ